MAPISLVEFTSENTMHSQQQRMHSITQNMTVNHALDVIRTKKTMPPELLSLIQNLEQHHNSKHLRAATAAATAAAPAGGYSGLQGARRMLSGMMLESTLNLDSEKVKCAEFQCKTNALMEEIRQDIATCSADAAGARGRIMAAQTQIEMISSKLPELNVELDSHRKKCKIAVTTLKSQRDIVLKDIETMNEVLKLTDCAAAASSSNALVQLGVVRCKHARRHGSRNLRNGTSFMAFGHSVVRRALHGLKSAVAKKELQRGLAEVFSETTSQKVLPEWHPAVLLQRSSCNNEQFPGCRGGFDPSGFRKGKKGCTIANNPACDRMRDKFLEIQSGIQDKADEMKDNLEKLIARCDETEKNFEAQIAEYETRLKDQQTKLADSTKDLVVANEQCRLKGIQLTDTDVEYKEGMRKCVKNIANFESEVCGADKIRGELDKMKGQNVFIQDCQLSDWIPETCSVTCGGGEQKLTRSVITLPVGDGMTCPPPEMKRACNEQPCPVDCELASWSGWSSCSTKCGGGVMQKSRIVETQPENGGKACGATTQENQCNIQSCDEDCELHEWTQWGNCSAACDGGNINRMRHVAVGAVGQGECPSASSSKRSQYMQCNTQACPTLFATGMQTMQCDAKFDVVILLDGSGSLRAAGFKAVQAAGEMLAKAFKGSGDDATPETGSRVAALLFSGPKTWGNYRKCLKIPNKGVEPPNMDTVCGLKWVSHFTSKNDEVATKIKGLAFPSSSTFTAGALALASAELKFGRPDAQQIVIVITDGRPLSAGKTGQQARKLARRSNTRLMWVPVTRYAPKRRIRRWASKPARDNVIVIKDFKQLESPDAVTDIIASACPAAHA